jgi:GNAT superfamily N-acetyltransferase
MIRPATEDDLGALLEMIRELASFESLLDECVCTEGDLREVLFGPDAFVHDTVAVSDDGAVVGHALWFPTFSTFQGKAGIWLEDLYVRPDQRRHGHGGALMADLRTRTHGRVDWSVLEWNEEAIDFYQRLGARPMGGWTTYRWTESPQP